MKANASINQLEVTLIQLMYAAADLMDIDSALPKQAGWDDFKSSFDITLAANQLLLRSLAHLRESESLDTPELLAS